MAEKKRAIHTGHRGRVKEEFLTRGIEGWPDHRVLELILFYAIPQGDVNPLAHELIDRFGSLSGALDMADDYRRNVEGADEESGRVSLFRGIFGSAEALEGSDNDLLALAEKLAAAGKDRPRLYAWCGTSDFLYQGNRKAWEHVRKLGYDLTCEESPGDHQWKYWDEKIQDVLRWWLGIQGELG